MKKMERENLHPDRGIKTKVLGLVCLVIGCFLLIANTHAFASNEQEKCNYLIELAEKPSQEFAKGLGDIPSKCISEKLCSFLGCANTRLTENILKH